MPSLKRLTETPISIRMTVIAFAAALLLGPLSARAGASADLESCFLAGINSQRAAAGAGALTTSGSLTGYGRSHSEAMATSGDIYHSAPGALNPYLPAGWESWGENVGMASDSASCQPLLNAFLASPGHRANLLNPAFDVAGIGVFVDAAGGMWTTHIFVAIAAATTTTTTTTTTVAAATTTTTTTTVAVTTSTSTSIAAALPTTTTTVTVPPAAESATTTLPSAPADGTAPSTTAAAPEASAVGQDDPSTTTSTAGVVQTPASTENDGQTPGAPEGGSLGGNDTPQASAGTSGHRCDGASCLWNPLILMAIGVAGFAALVMTTWAIRR